MVDPRPHQGSTDPRDPLGLAADAPLFASYLAALDDLGSGAVHPFVIPGHKGSSALTGAAITGDASLFGHMDTVKGAYGTLGAAERMAAEHWGADWCRFSVAGSTHGNQALALAVGRPGDEVVVNRSLHRSLLLGLVLAGLRPVWVRTALDPDTGLPTGVAPADVARALREHPRAVAVMLGDPSYVGTFTDLTVHADLAHDAGVPLVVDAAWAAHFGHHPRLPPHALAQGADAMVTSAHKALPAYTQAALVLARTERLDAGRLERAFDATHTTSPAGQLAASVDAARALLAGHGERLLGAAIEAVDAAKRSLASVDGLRVLDGAGVDPLKLVCLTAGTGADGIAVERDLLDAGHAVENADRDTVVATVTMSDTADDVARFVAALAASVERRRGEPRPSGAAAVPSWTVDPDLVVPPREAFFAPATTVTAAQAVGRVCAELVAPYPPGVPVLAPGERVTAGALDALRAAAAGGVRIAYAADPTLATLQVLRDS